MLRGELEVDVVGGTENAEFTGGGLGDSGSRIAQKCLFVTVCLHNLTLYMVRTRIWQTGACHHGGDQRNHNYNQIAGAAWTETGRCHAVNYTWLVGLGA